MGYISKKGMEKVLDALYGGRRQRKRFESRTRTLARKIAL
jgi:hypothetical protein